MHFSIYNTKTFSDINHFKNEIQKVYGDLYSLGYSLLNTFFKLALSSLARSNIALTFLNREQMYYIQFVYLNITVIL